MRNGNLGTALAIGGVGLFVTIAAVFGIVMLARALGGSQSTAVKVFAVMGIVCLALFVVAGLFATGCGAILAAA